MLTALLTCKLIGVNMRAVQTEWLRKGFAASGEKGSTTAKREQNILCLCLLHLEKADTMNLQYTQRRN